MSNLSEYDLYANVEDRRGIVPPSALPSVVPDSVFADPFPTGRLEMGTMDERGYLQPSPPPVSPEDRLFNLSGRSFGNLEGVDPRLVVVVGTAILTSPFDFIVIDGLRTKAEQRQLVREGRSKTLNSRHLTGHAVDLAIWHDGQVMWRQSMYRALAEHVLAVADGHGVPLEWGGDFKGFFDGPHFQLPWSTT